MRIPKYRAWDKQYKQMVNVTVISSETEEIDYEGNNNELKNWDHFELLEFTGLKDSNNVEIYEGDIVDLVQVNKELTKNIHFRGVVIWCRDRWQVDSDELEHIFDISSSDDVIIGNIYENPELLVKKSGGCDPSL